MTAFAWGVVVGFFAALLLATFLLVALEVRSMARRERHTAQEAAWERAHLN